MYTRIVTRRRLVGQHSMGSILVELGYGFYGSDSDVVLSGNCLHVTYRLTRGAYV